MPDGVTRPYSLWLSGHYPRALDGLARILSLDMRVVDPAWIGMKLRKLLDYSEPLGDFMAFVPGERRQQTWPSTVAYLARLVIHRYAMLGVLDERGFPTREMGVLESPRAHDEPAVMKGARCRECGNEIPKAPRYVCDFCFGPLELDYDYAAIKKVLTRELIVFKLGLEAKSPKAVEITLAYLLVPPHPRRSASSSSSSRSTCPTPARTS